MTRYRGWYNGYVVKLLGRLTNIAFRRCYLLESGSERTSIYREGESEGGVACQGQTTAAILHVVGISEQCTDTNPQRLFRIKPPPSLTATYIRHCA